jgi:hypothetical protein
MAFLLICGNIPRYTNNPEYNANSIVWALSLKNSYLFRLVTSQEEFSSMQLVN